MLQGPWLSPCPPHAPVSPSHFIAVLCYFISFHPSFPSQEGGSLAWHPLSCHLLHLKMCLLFPGLCVPLSPWQWLLRGCSSKSCLDPGFGCDGMLRACVPAPAFAVVPYWEGLCSPRSLSASQINIHEFPDTRCPCTAAKQIYPRNWGD